MKKVEFPLLGEEVYISTNHLQYSKYFIGKFLFVVENRQPYYIEGKVHEITGQDADDNLASIKDLVQEDCLQMVLSFYFKWDWCCHIQTDPDCMAHLCGGIEFDNFSSMILELKELVRTIEHIDPTMEKW